MIRCFFGALLLLATGGCRYEASSHPTVSGTDASLLVGASDSDKPVRVGRSTREQVRAELGDPDHATADRSVWTYEWSILSGRWFALGGSYERRDVRTLVLRFDDAGVLASRELLHSDATPGRPNARTPLPPEIVDEIYRPPVGTRLGQDGAGDVRE